MPDRSTTVAGYATQSTFDANRNVIYTAAADSIQRFDMASGMALPPITLSGGNRSVAVSPDGQYLVVGRSGYTIVDGVRVLHLVRIDLNTGEQVDLSIPLNTWSYETTVDQVVITASGSVLFSTQYDGSGHTPIRSFSLLSSSPPAVVEVGSAYMPQLIISPDRTQVLITTDNLSSSSFMRYEDGAARAVQTGLGHSGVGGAGTGGGDIADNGMMIRTGQNGFAVVDRNFNLVHNFSNEAWTRGYYDGQFSSDGRLMFAFAMNTDEIDVYDTTTWERVMSFPAPATAADHYLWGQVDLIGDFLVLVGSPYRYLVDLSTRLNFTMAGTAVAETIEGYGYADDLSGGDGADQLRGWAGDDRLDGGNGDDVLLGGAGSDTLNGGAGIDTADYTTAAAGMRAQLNSNSSTNDGDGGADTFSGIENLTGSAFNDLLIGDANVNVLRGGLGADTLLGLAGNDVIWGGSGTVNQLQGGLGDDRYVLEANDSVVEVAGEGNDTIEARINAYVLALNVENLVFGGTGNFAATGNAQANTITGGTGDDNLRGRGGVDVLNGGAGTDTVDYTLAAAGVTARLDLMRATNDGDGATDTFSGVENLTGSVYNDLLIGNAGNNVLHGGIGTDTLLGFGGDDILWGGSGGGNNQLQGGTGNDYYVLDAFDTCVEFAGEGIDTVEARIGSYTMGANIENLLYVGGAGTFVGTGNTLDNIITGGNGNDILRGRGGNDTIDGGLGKDEIQMRGLAADYTVTAEGAGYRIVDSVAGRDGSTFVTSIEVIRWSNNAVRTLSYPPVAASIGEQAGKGGAQVSPLLADHGDAFVLPPLGDDLIQVLPGLVADKPFGQFEVLPTMADKLFVGLESQLAHLPFAGDLKVGLDGELHDGGWMI